ncbi:DUF1045 domain-containing protein [Magnetospirillum sp. UT-4]|uniref:DUF1045 domain-containing protein n=1 Tax=Magnetospirillum sp. UT-4 TaxID=2681467 RepID=UPI00137D9162|nr:DUF1045 domain-containing protein [Magnetospirillum sp. UT-4]CAA7616892.1 conserved hypothetical protein [Magnetospirillum sp. UT-4]
MSLRYALYFAPEEGTALARFGQAWLAGAWLEGRDDLIAEPRLYGFHATLKPPFRLAEGRSRDELLNAAAEFARARPAFTAPALVLEPLDGFLALQPSLPSPAIDSLAADCVRHFDRFRAPPTEAELAKRLAAPLDQRHRDLLKEWGYPYVLDRFRFHLTLTRRLRDGEADIAAVARAAAAAALAEPVAFRSLCLFEQAAPGAAFRLSARFPFGG